MVNLNRLQQLFVAWMQTEIELQCLTETAQRYCLQLHDVPRRATISASCTLFCTTQLREVRSDGAKCYTVRTLCKALLDLIARQDFQDRPWIAPGSTDEGSVSGLRDTLTATPARRNFTLQSWFANMRRQDK